jgi:hypothetical protein
MAEMKTKPGAASVADFIAAVEDDAKRTDCETLLAMMEEATGAPAKMWGNIVGFGSYHYRYASGREGDLFLVGFAPRAKKVTLYIVAGFEAYDGLMGRLGKHKNGKSCLHINKLADVDEAVLTELVQLSVAAMRERYPDPKPE